MAMKWILFVVFMSIFVSTATITLLGLIQKVQIKEGYLKGLYAALILEVIGVLIGLGKSAEFFGDPLNDILNRLPSQVQSESTNEIIGNIESLVERPLTCDNCDEKVLSFVAMLPEDFQRATPEATIQAVNNKLVNYFNALQTRIETTSLELEACQNKENTCSTNQIGLLPKLMVLQSDIQRFGNINFQWNPGEKREIAFRVLEVMGELGYYQGKAEPNPQTAHEAVIAYQKKKQIAPSNGFFGKKTLLQLFNDFLHLE